MAVLTDEARKISALPAQAAIFDPLNIKHTYRIMESIVEVPSKIAILAGADSPLKFL